MEAIFTEYFWYLIGCLFIYALGYFTGFYHSDHITRKVIKESNIKAAQAWKQKEQIRKCKEDMSCRHLTTWL